MHHRRFFVPLVLVSGGMAILLFFLHYLPALQSHAVFSWISLAFFICWSSIMYFIGFKSARSENKYAFINAFLGLTFGKMALSIALILGYWRIVQPATKWFLLTFFGIYLVYTIFEVFFMMRLGRMKP